MPHSAAAKSLLVLGGARSGKSRYAQNIAEGSGRTPVLIATAEAKDAEMAARIARHVSQRSKIWAVVEEPIALAAALRREAAPNRILLVDCATLWLSNLLLQSFDPATATRDLAETVKELEGPVILVSNEVGQGIVPENALARSFRDAQGFLNQALAEACDGVVLVAAGLPLRLKPSSAPAFGF
jgi:adenosylcobinamide kinase/adenosylcobinamide-phosphate guanylyltransferase